MATFPARRTGRTLTFADPSREFEDIYERMSQLMNVASRDLAAVPADMPWSPTADPRRHRSSRRAGRFEYRTILPGDTKATEVRAELADGTLTVAARSRRQPGPAGSI